LQHPAFNPEVDKKTGFRTRSVLTMPVKDQAGKVLAVVQVINKKSPAPLNQVGHHPGSAAFITRALTPRGAPCRPADPCRPSR
jgi:hypothetical protein